MNPLDILKDQMSGWPLTLQKYSVWVNAVNTCWQAFAGALVMTQSNLMDPLLMAGITFTLTNLVTIAANASQPNIGSYDKTKFVLTPIEGA